MNDLKEKTIRGGFARITAQVANFVFRIGSLMILARLLGPKDFGLVGMVTAFTGVLNLFRDFGLSTATVQRETVTEEQVSTLFWINVLVGVILAVLAVALAPLVVRLYHEPRLFGITAVLSAGFLFNAAGIQHSARLQRQLRFTALAVINIVSLFVSTIAAISMAKLGYGYWALVTMTVTLPFTSTIGLWIATAWIPGAPRRKAGLRSIIRFGSTITLNGLVVYTAYNLEKILLGRFWGAEAIGLYGRAYQLISLPTDNLNSSVGEVAFSALSRVQGDPIRLKSYFLKGYSLVLALTIPITITSALFASDLIAVVLGPNWKDAALIFRLLAPTILIFAMINPLAWLLFSLGMVGRSLKIALVLAPLVITGYLCGLRFGPKGVAIGYSTVMALWLLPHLAWCVQGTVISLRDILLTVSRPLLSGIVAALPAFLMYLFSLTIMPALPRLLLETCILLLVYAAMLFYVMGQKRFYVDLIKGFRKRSTVEKKVLVPA
ncbi:MAG TPA: lipopolysaccharide biosynthesis protein [Terriglobales bacterium]|nr:lipopolysaccharide biosynthesis protein [Terriglobales bacterium]